MVYLVRKLLRKLKNHLRISINICQLILDAYIILKFDFLLLDFSSKATDNESNLSKNAMCSYDWKF